MDKISFKATDYNTIQTVRDYLTGLEVSPESPKQVVIQDWREKRSLDQNSLYWMWLGELANHFSEKAGPFCKDDMHDLMRHRHLGYTDRKIGNTEIKSQLISTTELTTAGMAEYMTKVEAWAADHGCLLPVPAHCEYSKYREAA